MRSIKVSPAFLIQAFLLLLVTTSHAVPGWHRVVWDDGGADNEFTNIQNWQAIDEMAGTDQFPGFATGGATNAIIQGAGFSGANAANLSSDFTPANFFSPLIVRGGSHLNIAANLNIPGTGFLAGQTGTNNVINHTAGTVTSGALTIGNTTEAANTSQYNLSGTGVIAASAITIENSGRLNLGSGGSTASPITINTANAGSITGVGTGGTLSGPITLATNADFRGNNVTLSGGVTGANRNLSLNGKYLVNSSPIDLDAGTLTITSNGNSAANASELNVGGNDWNLMRINFGGYLKLGGADFLPTDSDVEFGWSTLGFSSGTLNLNGFDQTVASIGVTPFFAGMMGDQNITGGGTLTVNQTAASKEYQGRITDGTTATALTKTGTGTMILNNLSGTPNNFTGDTTINGGVLQVTEGTTITSTTINVNAGTLAGSGALGNAGTDTVALNSGGTLSPGDSAGADIGTLEITGALTLANGSNTILQLQSAGPGNTVAGADFLDPGTVGDPGTIAGMIDLSFDPIDGPTGEHDAIESGTITLTSGGTIQVVDLGVGFGMGQYFDLFDGTISAGSFAVGPRFRSGSRSDLFDLKLPDLAATAPALRWDTSLFISHGILFIVPEPSRTLLLLGGFLCLLARRRRR